MKYFKLNVLSKVLLAFSIVLPQATLAADAIEFQLNKDNGKISALAIGKPRALKIEVEGSGPEGKIEYTAGKLQGKVTVDLASLETGIGLRDKHLKNKYLEIEKYPLAMLELETSISSKKLMTGIKDNKFVGNLTLHGVTKEISGVFAYPGLSTGGDLVASFEIKLSDFKVDVPSYLGVTVAEIVQVVVTLEDFKGQKANQN